MIPSALGIPYQSQSSTCRNFPGDFGWPSKDDWSQLNTTTGGKLIQGVPLASPCFSPILDREACDMIRDNWTELDIR